VHVGTRTHDAVVLDRRVLPDDAVLPKPNMIFYSYRARRIYQIASFCIINAVSIACSNANLEGNHAILSNLDRSVRSKNVKILDSCPLAYINTGAFCAEHSKFSASCQIFDVDPAIISGDPKIKRASEGCDFNLIIASGYPDGPASFVMGRD
jgi:hypothetical protein